MNEKDFLYTLKQYLKEEGRNDILELMKNCQLKFNFTSVFASKSYQFRAYVDIRVPVHIMSKLKKYQSELNKYCGEIFIEDEQYAFYGVDIKPFIMKEETSAENKTCFADIVNKDERQKFKISDKTEEALAQIITGDNGKSFYRKGYELVDFFNQFGFEDRYGNGFSSRITYAREKVKEINKIEKIDEMLEVLFDPRDYFDNETLLINSVEYINKYLKFDGYILIKDSEFYKLKTYKGSKINNIEENKIREVKEIRHDDTSNKKIKLFFSYSHKDEELRDELEKHLIMLKRQGVITTWYDRKIDAGSALDKEIDDNLNDSNIILLLISVDFLASDYCYDIEMKEALKMHENKQAVVVPVILRSCDWTSAPFSKLMALPTDGKSITTWGDKDSAFVNVAKGIKNIATKL
ncbi:toll/interleukin-1 receptor domain-containing protein [Clostridium beijerinckii]|uniref:toll/interleukin-1 receptor domain-containing protein n=1 Tax=Clostridium beijerinckii TaxID=1520 RepID=UPI0009CC5030|nr:toll/interleukin-1 receptor domain-containing protein [Clostridium beijerinckii]MBA8937630.1 hypothetical protein [Clostridium beijerinckii]NRU41278.1 hypothetical protein [Clostridium beijerinckii]NSA95447.1 hypothetical protein [Clostridium beijerinckii]OOM55235.1 hypothetical protein CLOBI_45740 [Clostridium beijerinckii]OOM66479.1 hypothetical protein CLBEIC_47870 [Clostridium beijerinckii]